MRLGDTACLRSWVREIGLDASAYGTHTLRRTKASLIYRRTKNLRAVQLLLGHTKLESTVRYLGIEVDDALEMAELTEVQTASRRRPTPRALIGQMRTCGIFLFPSSATSCIPMHSSYRS